MIDPAATPTTTPLGSVIGAVAPGAAPVLAASGNPVDPAAFAALLRPDEAPAPAETAAPAGSAKPLATRQGLAALPAMPLAAGKTLPDLLPRGDTAEPVQSAAPAGPPVPVLPLLRAVRPLDAEGPARPRAAASEQATTATDEPAETAPLAVPALVFTLSPLPVAADPAPGALPATSSTPPQLQAAALLLPPAIAAQLMGQALPRQDTPPQAEAAAPDDARTLRLPAAPAPFPGQAEAQFTIASPTVPSASTSLHLRPVVEALTAAPTDSTAPGALPTPIVDATLTSQSALPATAAAPAGAASIGHSFAAVVDRLMAARDAVQADNSAQPVAINLRHAEFGTVSVRFEQRADGLSVALASPDPDFARAVQSATPASGGRDADLAGNFAGGNGWALGSSGAGAQSQQGQRGSANAQPERFSAAEANPARPRAPVPGETTPRGIYA